MKSERKSDLLQLSARSCRWSFKVRLLSCGVTILPTSASVSTSLPSSCNWSYPNTESLGEVVMLRQQRAVCHLSIASKSVLSASLSKCLAWENAWSQGAVDLR